MDLGLAKDLVVVVGGAHGIGRAIAERFAAEGASPLLVDIAATTQEVAQEIADAHGVTAWGQEVDATDYEGVCAVAEYAQRLSHPRTHVVVAAGGGSGKYGFPFWNLQPADWSRVLELNLLSAVNAAHAFVPLLTEQQRGTMLFIASIAGQIGSQTDPPYSAAKAGLINFTQCAAKDLAEHDVRVNAIAPGMIKTTLNQSVWQAWHDRQPPEQQQSYETWGADKIRRVAPLGRWQEPEDVAAMAAFLASDQARNVTGQVLNVDGGQVMR